MSAAPALRAEAPLVDGEYVFTARDFDRIATLLRSENGISLTQAKATLVYSRLAKRLRKLGIASFDAYLDFVSKKEGGAERREMFAALTTNVTRFFREPHHFDYLRKLVVARLKPVATSGGRIRLWSAACSSGEEPYSMALTLLEAFPDVTRYDVRILATDVDPNIIGKAKAGVYSTDAVAPIAAEMRERWLSCDRHAADKTWRVRDEVRSLISFKELNLIQPWPMRGRFDVVFCRNVVIYFEEQTQAMLWRRFRDVMTPEGRLYIGHSERVDVEGYVSDGLTAYRLAGQS